MDHAEFHKTTLPNGLRILTERHPHVKSATVGIWIMAGSIYEQNAESGLAHLLEHMVFKGTQRRSTHQIAATMDSIGGQMNAFTEREFVCYHAKVLSEHTALALELICDLVTSPRLDSDDLEIERGVILEEINAVEDAPEELVEDLFRQTIWSRSPWGRSILGTPSSVEKLSVQDLKRFIETHYTPANVVLAAVGNIAHDDIVRRAEKLLNGLPHGQSRARRRQPRQPTVRPHHLVLSRDTEQAHLCCGTHAYRFDDPRRFAAWALDTILTGGYASRLFQEIREKRGLCYNIGPLSASYRAAGFWAVETSVAPEVARRVVELIGKELRHVKRDGVKRVELKRAKQMARANLLLAEESSSAQMSRIAMHELYFGRQKPTAEVLSEVQAVTLEAVHAAAIEMFDPLFMNLTAIGPFGDGAPALRLDVG